ncbi:ferripyochelin-binding protein, putative [Brucella vulpis]|nr:ferripyochelin-binding protein, putative [Brucella vulpis]CUW50866.1 ferripyochelin-binding protein, putative [Brucella vulpis]
MPIYAYNGHKPQFADRESNWIAPDATLIGKVVVGENAGFWFGAVLAAIMSQSLSVPIPMCRNRRSCTPISVFR